jgi:hypothetical protein
VGFIRDYPEIFGTIALPYPHPLPPKGLRGSFCGNTTKGDFYMEKPGSNTQYPKIALNFISVAISDMNIFCWKGGQI